MPKKSKSSLPWGWLIVGAVVLVIVIAIWFGREPLKKTFHRFIEYTKDTSKGRYDPNNGRNKLFRYDVDTNLDSRVYTLGSMPSNGDRIDANIPTRRGRTLNKHEEMCREIFERLFNVPFKKIRPKWLKNPVTKRCLELDGFNEGVKTPLGEGLAFEYDGDQHSRFTPHFQSCPEEFQYQVKKDELKDIVCEKRGVLLVRIPSFVAYDDLERFITAKLFRMGMKVGDSSIWGSSDPVLQNYELADRKFLRR